MVIAEVLVEYGSYQVDKTFTYAVGALEVLIGARVFVMFNNRKVVGIVMNLKELEISKAEYEKINNFKLANILEVIDETPILNAELLQLANHLHQTTLSPLINCLSVMLPSKLKVRSSFKPAKLETFLIPLEIKEIKLTPLQMEAYTYIKNNQMLKQRDFNKVFKHGMAQRLLNKKAIKRVLEEARYESVKVKKNKALTLTSDQQKVYDEFINSDDLVYLLHGVTGSGKTEIYLQLAEATLKSNQAVLILVPEISLTPQMIKQVKNRFGDQVAIYHSYLNDQEKYEQYQRVKNQEVKITVGTRSSIFMPFDNIGLIILDEEHDRSYKQDSLPRYHARDVAIFRAKYHKAKVLLASATPALQSYAKAYKKIYTLLSLPNRISKHQKINYRIINTQKALYAGEDAILSPQLNAAIADRLAKNEQVVILLNRRGFTPVLTCKNCFKVKMCQDCDIALSYHRNDNILVCHICGYSESMPTTCNHCQNDTFAYSGYGTQKVESKLKQTFKDAHIVRMDLDQVGKKGSHERLLNEFEDKGDILLGTQMIAKGLDFHRVSLVAVLNADSLLARTSYRASEDTFNLINQVSGRGGRGDLASELIVQAFDAKHYAILLACENDYLRFFNLEMQYRHLANYPPYSYLIKVVLSSHNEQLLNEKTNVLFKKLQNKSFDLLGPSQLIKIKRDYRNQFILRAKDLNKMLAELAVINDQFKKHLGSVKILIDVNPMEME